ncbi:TPA: transposase family protein [Pseudomonas aeruginosa]|nr:transposase family protein [Pseudomonas aeruginosa]HBP0655269.1 transposase family protein [Pseudomonas aeruginosa]HBP0742385.1 transposase family protein [Pseudomonas aeruginosa]HBP1031360.1 transposase family protein [Pseudomonas aeruginosa]HBP1412858.1 transposase family protein [Pseudomonas aeruginosa]
MSAVMTQRLVALAHEMDRSTASRTELCQAAADDLRISLATLYRKLKEVTVTQPRKKRVDAGTSALTRDEAELLSTTLIRSIRDNDKQLSTLERAVERLRNNGKIVAGSVDHRTGEVTLMSLSAIGRALRAYGLHPEQLLRPAPAVELVSLHPNHVWQIDASISTQFYLANDGARAMNKAEFYDGKPENLKRIEKQRLWRYVITDHTSGTLYVHYVLGAESAENLCHVLISAMVKRGDTDPFHGVPFMIMTDPGAAMTSSMFRNLCRALGIELIINKVGNARAKGQVEQAHNIVEREFESGLQLMQKPRTLDEINGLAGRWMRHYNATAIHTRHHRTRYAAWMTIKPEQLRIAPPAETMRELAIAAPEKRKVSARLRVPFRGAEYDVSVIQHLQVGDQVLVTRNPFRDADSAQVVLVGDDGREHYQVVERVERDDNGFAANAATRRVIGEERRALPETAAQKDRKHLDQLATGTSSVTEAEKAIRSRAVPFNGEIDPFKEQANTVLPTYLPKRGTELETRVTVAGLASVELKPLNRIELAKALRARLGTAWTPASMEWLKTNYPEGAMEEQLDSIVQQLQAPARPSLRLVGGE